YTKPELGKFKNLNFWQGISGSVRPSLAPRTSSPSQAQSSSAHAHQSIGGNTTALPLPTAVVRGLIRPLSAAPQAFYLRQPTLPGGGRFPSAVPRHSLPHTPIANRPESADHEEQGQQDTDDDKRPGTTGGVITIISPPKSTSCVDLIAKYGPVGGVLSVLGAKT
ncbi:unnamed protein product, partial [Cyprideis torosa]